MNEQDEAIRANHLLMIRWRTVANELAEALEAIRQKAEDQGGPHYTSTLVSIESDADTALAKYREAVDE